MSEYQFYEFRALDRPLTKDDLAKVRAISSRAELTPTSFVNVYHWGNFKGDEVEFLACWYDAHLYNSNWGTRRLMFALPRPLRPGDHRPLQRRRFAQSLRPRRPRHPRLHL